MTDEVVKTLLAEMARYLPLLERAEADPAVWAQLTQGTGIATTNAYRQALAVGQQNTRPPALGAG